jgi:hypothetical protein
MNPQPTHLQGAYGVWAIQFADGAIVGRKPDDAHWRTSWLGATPASCGHYHEAERALAAYLRDHPDADPSGTPFRVNLLDAAPRDLLSAVQAVLQ